MHFASQAEADAYILKHQIKEIEESGKAGERRARPRLDKMREQLNALAAPVYRLPDYMLQLIFECGFDADPQISFGILVSHVASRWRRVALDTPKLWSVITVRLPMARTRKASRTALFIERARAHTIDLRITLSNYLDDDAKESIQSWLEPLHGRFRVIALHSGRFFPTFGSVHLLKQLKISHGNFCNIDEDEAEHMDLNLLLNVFRQCSNLESLHLDSLILPSYPIRSLSNPIPLINLRFLTIQEINIRRILLGFAALIDAPRLDDLDIRFIPREGYPFQYLLHSNPEAKWVPSDTPAYFKGVQHLRIENPRNSDFRVDTFLQLMTKVTGLTIAGLIDHELLEPLLDSMDTVVPQLKDVSMDGVSFKGSDTDVASKRDTLMRFAESQRRRAQAGLSCITSVKLQQCAGMDEELRSYLTERLREISWIPLPDPEEG